MTNFGYIGHDMILDKGLKEKIMGNIQELITKDNCFNFYFLTLSRFPSYIYEQVQQIKTERKDLTIKTVLVTVKDENVYVPGEFDEIIAAPNCIENWDFTMNIKRAQRWMFENSDFLLMYLYPAICEEDQGILAFIQKQVEAKRLTILDLTDNRTSTIINAQIDYLRPNQKSVREKLLIGKTYKEVAEEMGISVARVRQIYFSSCSRLHTLAYCAISKM